MDQEYYQYNSSTNYKDTRARKIRSKTLEEYEDYSFFEPALQSQNLSSLLVEQISNYQNPTQAEDSSSFPFSLASKSNTKDASKDFDLQKRWNKLIPVVQQLILGFCDLRSVLRFSQTSKFVRGVVNSVNYWDQYIKNRFQDEFSGCSLIPEVHTNSRYTHAFAKSLTNLKIQKRFLSITDILEKFKTNRFAQLTFDLKDVCKIRRKDLLLKAYPKKPYMDPQPTDLKLSFDKDEYAVQVWMLHANQAMINRISRPYSMVASIPLADKNIEDCYFVLDEYVVARSNVYHVNEDGTKAAKPYKQTLYVFQVDDLFKNIDLEENEKPFFSIQFVESDKSNLEEVKEDQEGHPENNEGQNSDDEEIIPPDIILTGQFNMIKTFRIDQNKLLFYEQDTEPLLYIYDFEQKKGSRIENVQLENKLDEFVVAYKSSKNTEGEEQKNEGEQSTTIDLYFSDFGFILYSIQIGESTTAQSPKLQKIFAPKENQIPNKIFQESIENGHNLLAFRYVSYSDMENCQKHKILAVIPEQNLTLYSYDPDSSPCEWAKLQEFNNIKWDDLIWADHENYIVLAQNNMYQVWDMKLNQQLTFQKKINTEVSTTYERGFLYEGTKNSEEVGLRINKKKKDQFTSAFKPRIFTTDTYFILITFPSRYTIPDLIPTVRVIMIPFASISMQPCQYTPQGNMTFQHVLNVQNCEKMMPKEQQYLNTIEGLNTSNQFVIPWERLAKVEGDSLLVYINGYFQNIDLSKAVIHQLGVDQFFYQELDSVFYVSPYGLYRPRQPKEEKRKYKIYPVQYEKLHENKNKEGSEDIIYYGYQKGEQYKANALSKLQTYGVDSMSRKDKKEIHEHIRKNERLSSQFDKDSFMKKLAKRKYKKDRNDKRDSKYNSNY